MDSEIELDTELKKMTVRGRQLVGARLLNSCLGNSCKSGAVRRASPSGLYPVVAQLAGPRKHRYSSLLTPLGLCASVFISTVQIL